MLHLFMTHLEGYKKIALRSPFVMVLEAVCQLLLPLVMADVVDKAIPSGEVSEIFRLGCIMLALTHVGVNLFSGVV